MKLLIIPPTTGAARDRITSAPVLVFHKTGSKLATMVATVIAFGRSRRRAPSITASIKSDLGAGRIFADPSRIQSMITNLLTNAIKFTPNGGTISMMLDSNGREILLSVRDTGMGIPRDQHTRIFRKFYRVDRENTAIPGTGLGLPIVLSIVEHHGGRIEVESEEGKGACFRVYLPVFQDTQA